MHLSRVYSSSTERIITRSSSNSTFDIELQHPQPRRRQTFDLSHENDYENDQYRTDGFSMKPKQEEFTLSNPEYLSFKNSVAPIPTNLPSISAPDPLLMVPRTPEIIEET